MRQQAEPGLDGEAVAGPPAVAAFARLGYRFLPSCIERSKKALPLFERETLPDSSRLLSDRSQRGSAVDYESWGTALRGVLNSLGQHGPLTMLARESGSGSARDLIFCCRPDKSTLQQRHTVQTSGYACEFAYSNCCIGPVHNHHRSLIKLRRIWGGWNRAKMPR